MQSERCLSNASTDDPEKEEIERLPRINQNKQRNQSSLHHQSVRLPPKIE